MATIATDKRRIADASSELLNACEGVRDALEGVERAAMGLEAAMHEAMESGFVRVTFGSPIMMAANSFRQELGVMAGGSEYGDVDGFVADARDLHELVQLVLSSISDAD